MRTQAAMKSERIDLRTTQEDKRVLARAAEFEQSDLTSYILSKILPIARKTVRQAELLTLSARDSAHVLDLLENPPEPSPALEKAFRRLADNRL